MKLIVFDTESDDLYKKATKIHVMSWTSDGKTYESTNDYDVMRKVISECDIAVCHNVVGHDMPLLEKLLSIPMNYRKYADSLALSRYLFPERTAHSVDSWGVTLGIKKPIVEDWKTLTYEEYKHRCEEDVKINYKMWREIYKRLHDLYPTQEQKLRIIHYLSFKMDCMREQEEIGWKLNVPLASRTLEELLKLEEERKVQLEAIMPKVPKYVTKNPPKNSYKKDGSLSAAGERWQDLLETEGLPGDYDKPVKVVDHLEDPNANSSDQVKEWLETLGWTPATFKYVKDKDTGAERAIPQVKRKGELCPSVERLADSIPEVKLLSDLSVIQHRIGVFKGFLRHEQDGWIEASTSGFTNTLRFTHTSPAVNLPGVDKPWGKEIRGCLIAPTKAHKICGADMKSLEATTKAHFIYPHDPDYAMELTKDDFDEHLDLAVQSKEITKEEYTYYTLNDLEGDAKWDRLHKVRKNYKPVNYGGVYGIGKVKLARETGWTQKVAQDMLDEYWKRNWAVKECVKHLETKTVGGHTWLLNPVSKLWYQLRFDKDRFSTLNQGTGVFLFDSWVARVRARGIKICGQFHDEVIFWTLHEDSDKKKLKDAIRDLNDSLELNVKLDIDVKFGDNYSDVH